MEQWNKKGAEEFEKFLEEIFSDVDKPENSVRVQYPDEDTEAKNNTVYQMGDIYDEVWEDKMKLEAEKNQNSDCSDDNNLKQPNKNVNADISRSDVDSYYRGKLNSMFEALFDCGYKEILIKSGHSYIVREWGKCFLKFLLKSHSTREGRKLRQEQYKDLDFLYENHLLFYASKFLEEWEEQEGTKYKTKQELCKKIIKKFSLTEGKFQARKTLGELNHNVEALLEDTEINESQYLRMAKEIEGLAKKISFEVQYW